MAAKLMAAKTEVQHHDGVALLLPVKMSHEDGIEVLQRDLKALTTVTQFTDLIPCYPWDGAIALGKALREQFGVLISADLIPQVRTVNVSLTEKIQIPWGTFALPGLRDGSVTCSVGNDEAGLYCFKIVVNAYLRDQPKVETLFARIRELALSESIYRGKALDFSYNAGNGGLPKLTFKALPTDRAIFDAFTQGEIEANILVPIWYREASRRVGVPTKLGVLLAGVYGTGKTLVAANIAQEALKNGFTFIEVENPNEIASAVAFASRIGPTIMLVEDIDRVVGPVRTDEVNTILNMIDGAGTKDRDLIMLFTSNHPENINGAMRRDGRIDFTLEISAPDADAVRQIILQYGGKALDPKSDLTAVGEILAGTMPSKVREVIERAKKRALHRTQGVSGLINGDDLAMAGRSVLKEAKLFAPKMDVDHPLVHMGRGLGEKLGEGFNRLAAIHGNGTAKVTE